METRFLSSSSPKCTKNRVIISGKIYRHARQSGWCFRHDLAFCITLRPQSGASQAPALRSRRHGRPHRVKCPQCSNQISVSRTDSTFTLSTGGTDRLARSVQVQTQPTAQYGSTLTWHAQVQARHTPPTHARAPTAIPGSADSHSTRCTKKSPQGSEENHDTQTTQEVQ